MTTEQKEQLTPNKVLMNNIDKLVNVVVLGFTKEGELQMETSRPTYEFMNYILNRAIFNINLLETNSWAAEQQAKRVAAENKVTEAVKQDIEEQVAAMAARGTSGADTMKKRGRPKKEVL